MVVFYFVHLSLDSNIADEYLQWLKEHMKEILSYSGFEDGKILDRDRTTLDSIDKILKTVMYTVKDRESLADYFDNSASLMRQQAIDKFGNRFSARREVLESI